MREGFEVPGELPKNEESEQIIRSFDEGDFVVDERGFKSLEDLSRELQEGGSEEIMDQAA